MLRTPVLSPAEFNETAIKDKLATSYIKAAIFMASISLWEELEKINWHWNLLTDKQKFTIYKYWNRMCYRPTPFGLFSTTHAATWGDNTDTPVTLPSALEGEILLLPDFKLLTYLAGSVPIDKSDNLIYYLNKTIYETQNGYRYIFKARLPANEPAEVLSINKNTFINALMTFCNKGRTTTELLDFLHGYTPDAEDMLEELADQQIIYSELSPNISGEFFADKLRGYNSHGLNAALSLFTASGYQPVKNVIEDVSRLLPLKELRELSFFKHNYYAVSKSGVQVKFPEEMQAHLLDAFYALNKLSVLPELQGLNTFKEKFKTRYDQKSVPLLLALDPEYGLGYIDLDADPNESEITDNLVFEQPDEQPVLKWTAVHKLLVNKLTQANQSITLTDAELQNIGTLETGIPPALQMVFRSVDDKILMEEAGGANGFYLYSRFSVNNPLLQQQCRQIAETEQQLNPGVVFAEVSFIPEEHAVNVNIRASFYDYEIPVQVQSVRNTDQVIDLNDLYLNIINNELVLFSKHLNKRVIPRFNSAYNFNRSANTIIRFLGDLQFQGIRPNLTFNFQQLIPGLNFYPRIEYKNVILSPAQWVLTDFDRDLLIQDIGTLLAKLKALNIPTVFAVVEHDNHLVFNQEHRADMELFFNVCQQNKKITLKETLLAKHQATTVNENGDEVINQLVTTLINQQEVYKNVLPPDPLPERSQRNFNPGQEWFYIKLYSHKNVATEFLATGLSTILNKLVKQKIAAQWFFIRYKDPDSHLRIRIRSNQADIILEEFNRIIKSAEFKDRFYHITVENYTREIERYKFINEAEAAFHASSALVLKYLTAKIKNKTQLSDLQFAIVTCTALLRSMGINSHDAAQFLNEIALFFLNEKGYTKSLKLQLDKKYRAERQNIDDALAADMSYFKKELLALNIATDLYFTKMKQSGYETMQEYYTNILHMHFNRLFADDQRKKEGVIYYLLAKHQLSLIARRKTVA